MISTAYFLILPLILLRIHVILYYKQWRYSVDNSKIPYEFRGELAYAIQKMRTMQRAGYKTIKQRVHSDKTITITMEKKLY